MSEHQTTDTPVGRELRPPVPVDPAMVERAKGAIMLRLGVGSPEALGLLLAWAKDAHTDLPHLAEVVVRGLCHGEHDVIAAEPLLVRWLETRMAALESG